MSRPCAPKTPPAPGPRPGSGPAQPAAPCAAPAFAPAPAPQPAAPSPAPLPGRRPARLRLALQSAFALTCLWAGWEFFRFVSWVLGQGPGPVTRPPAVEGFLPISAFLALRRLLATGQWDPVHPAGLTILLAALLMALLLRKGFCGHVCPVGLVHNLLARAGRTLGWARTLPRRAALALAAPKYLLLAFFVWTTWVGMDLAALEGFLRTPYNIAADAKMLAFFLAPSGTTLAVLGVLAALGLVLPYFWCRFLCPYGALLGLAALASPLAVRRDAASCIQCGRCTRVCPGAIRVQEKTRVNSPECVGCMECTGACPVPGCLGPALGAARMPWALAGLGCAAVLLALYAWARATGHWDATLAPAMLGRIYRMVLGGF